MSDIRKTTKAIYFHTSNSNYTPCVLKNSNGGHTGHPVLKIFEKNFTSMKSYRHVINHSEN